MSDTNWFTSMGSDKPGDNDSIAATTLNITKIVPTVLTVLTLIAGAFVKYTDNRLTAWQMITLFGMLLLAIVALCITDVVVRGYVTVRQPPAPTTASETPVRTAGVRAAATTAVVEPPGEEIVHLDLLIPRPRP